MPKYALFMHKCRIFFKIFISAPCSEKVPFRLFVILTYAARIPQLRPSAALRMMIVCYAAPFVNAKPFFTARRCCRVRILAGARLFGREWYMLYFPGGRQLSPSCGPGRSLPGLIFASNARVRTRAILRSSPKPPRAALPPCDFRIHAQSINALFLGYFIQICALKIVHLYP